MQFIGSSSDQFVSRGLDNRLKIWTVSSCKEKAQLVEKNHLSNKYTCYAWGNKSIASRGSSSGGSATVLVVGTEAGHVIVWDLSRGVVVQDTAVAAHAIADVTFSFDCKSVYYVTTAGDVVMRLSVGGKNAGEAREEVKMDTTVMGGTVKRLAMNPKLENVMAAAGTSVGVVQLSTGLSRGLKAAVAGGAGALAYSSCGFFVLCAGATKREVLLFSSQATAKVTPVTVLTARGSVARIKARSNRGRNKGNVVEVLVILQEGGLNVFRVRLGKDGSSEESCETCFVKSDEPVMDAVFGDGSAGVLIAARFQKEKKAPVFDDLRYVGEGEGDSAPVVTEKALPSLSASEDDQASGLNGLSDGLGALGGKRVLGPFEMGAAKRPMQSGENGSDALLSTDATGRKKSRNGLATDDGTTMEERLEKISANLTAIENSSAAKYYAAGEMETTPTSDTLVTLIGQALQSGDESLLEQCLAISDSAVVEQTAKQLESTKVVSLIAKLTTKFEKRPARGLLMTDWLDSLLRNHTSYLISVPELASQLAALSQMFELRLSYYSKLAGLSGRLELLMSQFTHRSGAAAGSGSDTVSLEPERVVVNRYA